MNILIIGASGGIGSQLVSDLAEDNANLLLGYYTNPTSGSAKSMKVDARNFDSVMSFIQTGKDKFGEIDGVVNLSGSLILKPPHLCSEEDFVNTINTNLKTAFSTVRACGSLLRNTSVVLMSTAAASIGLVNHELIASSKAGVEGLVVSASKTYARKNLRFNTISPGLVDTPLTQSITSNEISLAASKKMHPLGRIGTPKNISNMIRFLLNKENDWITGQNYIVDGGLSSSK